MGTTWRAKEPLSQVVQQPSEETTTLHSDLVSRGRALISYLQHAVVGYPEDHAPYQQAVSSPCCPQCREALEKSRVQGIFVDRCPECHGIWLNPEALEFLLLAVLGDTV